MKHILLSLTLLNCHSFAENIPFYVGTSSTDGIFKLTLDTDTGKLSEANVVAKVIKPSSLSIGPKKKFLYTTATIRPEKSKKGISSVQSYAIQEDFSLTPINNVDSGGKGGCHLFAHPNGSNLFVANYSSGSVASFKVSKAGIISEPISVIQHTGSSVNERRQQEPHAHSIYASPDGQYVYAADLGTDEVICYSLDQDTAEMKRASAIKTPPGSGPRHMTFNKDGSILYVLNELTLTVSKTKRNPADGSLELIDTQPITKEISDNFTCSEIRLSDDQKFLYVAKRDLKGTGKDLICVVHPETLEIIQEHPAGAWIPRHINLSPSGKWLLVAGQRDNKIIVHQRDPETGKLSNTKEFAEVIKPMWILFP